MSEYDPEYGIFMGFVTGMPFPEWGSVSIQDFIHLKLSFGMKIERDIHFSSRPFTDCVSESNQDLV